MQACRLGLGSIAELELLRWRAELGTAEGERQQLELLDARCVALRGRRAAERLRTVHVDATISLLRALGGGW